MLNSSSETVITPNTSARALKHSYRVSCTLLQRDTPNLNCNPIYDH